MRRSSSVTSVSDTMGHPKYGFVLATGFAGLLFAGWLLNRMFDPARELLSRSMKQNIASDAFTIYNVLVIPADGSFC
jgi:hypothetical protein